MGEGAKQAATVVGAIFALLDVIMIGATVVFARQKQKTTKRLAQMGTHETSTVADARLNGIVELVGVAKPIDESPAHLLDAPLSGRRCLWWRVEIDEVQGSSFRPVTRKSEARDFYLDDGSGAFALVRTSHAKFGIKSHSQNLPEQKERLAVFLQKHAIDKPIDDLIWSEETIDAHVEVYVIGRALPPEPSRDADGPFRSSALHERFVVDAPEDDRGELVISIGHEAALSKKLHDELANAIGEMKGFAIFSAVFSAIVAGLFAYAAFAR